MKSDSQDSIAVVDFGGQYAHLIATKVRRHHVRADIVQPEDAAERFAPYKGVILSGSPALASHGEETGVNKAIFELDVPILGLCFGHQQIAEHYGGKVVHGGREWGAAQLHLVRDHPLFEGLERTQRVWMSHFDSVAALGEGFEELGYSESGDGSEHRNAAIVNDALRRYGFQFHAEVDDTEHGDQLLENFAKKICGCTPSWTMERYIGEQVARIRQQVGDSAVFLLASGGVDSTVAAKILAQALGPERLVLLHIDNGMMRKGESARVLALLRDQGLGENLHFIDASDDFLQALDGVIEPEHKRTIIGETFIDVFDREAHRLGLQGHLLGQGTIYPDTIESGGTKRAHTIKTHHNRVPLIEKLIDQGRVVEPLCELYKTEVRELGEVLGLPHKALWRHPFPGPGLGVRLLCSDGAPVDTSALQHEVDAALVDARIAGIAATVLPVKSVGVKADVRSYERPVLLTGPRSWRELLLASTALLKRVLGINRCLWNLHGEVPRCLAPRAATMTRQRLDLLREADAIVMQALRDHGLYDAIWQCPTVFVPLASEPDGRELCVVRPVLSERAMTAQAAELDPAVVSELSAKLSTLEGVGCLAIDLTSKPPGTIEWE